MSMGQCKRSAWLWPFVMLGGIWFSPGCSTLTFPRLEGCPGGTHPCGAGCLIDSATCCNLGQADDQAGTFECPGGHVASCTINQGTGSCGNARYCCSGSGSQDFGSLDCTNGTVVCNQNCVVLGATCCSLMDSKDCVVLNGSNIGAKGDGGTASSSGGGSCPGGFLGSARGCIGGPTGCQCNSNPTTYCFTPDLFTKAGHQPPAACTPQGQTNCVDSTGFLAAPCCPGLSCVQGTSCAPGAPDVPGNGLCWPSPGGGGSSGGSGSSGGGGSQPCWECCCTTGNLTSCGPASGPAASCPMSCPGTCSDGSGMQCKSVGCNSP